MRIAFAKFADFCFCVEKYGFIEIGFLDFRLAFVGSHKKSAGIKMNLYGFVSCNFCKMVV